MKRYLWLSFLFWCVCGAVNAAVITQVDPPSVQFGETFHLTLTIDDAQTRGMPDLTPLQHDFIIMGTERSMKYTIVNGQANSVSQWSVLLKARRKGVVPIPEISVGQQKSQATSIDVTADNITPTDNNQTTNAADAVMLRTEADQSQPFVNQQVIYTVKLYNSERLLDAAYQPPTVDDALLIPLGDGRRYQTTENGRSYAVEEQKYAVFPQKSGSLQIIAPSFNALVYDVVPRRVNIKGETVKLNVQPMPGDYSGQQWLPAKQVTLKEEYNKNATTVLQGSTLVRTVTLEAVAMPAQLFPTISFSDGAEFNVYPEKPEVNNTVKQQELVGTSTVKVTYLLNKAGHITIPEVQVPWFNTVIGKQEMATLPAMPMMVDAKGSQPALVNPPNNKSAESAVQSTMSSSNVPEQSTGRMTWVLVIIFALAWLITLGLWWYRPQSFNSGELRTAVKQLQEACAENNPSYAQEAVLRWAALQWPNAELLNLEDVASFVHDPQFKKQLLLLTQVLYSQDKKVRWHGAELWRRASSYRHKKVIKKIKSRDLPPINPG